MDKYFLVTERTNGDFSVPSMKVEVLETKKLCEVTLVNREKEGYKLVKIIKGRELKVRSKKVVVEYEIDETIHLGPPEVTVRQLDD